MRRPSWLDEPTAKLCKEHGLLPIYDRPGMAWWEGTDPYLVGWVPVNIEIFLKNRGNKTRGVMSLNELGLHDSACPEVVEAT